MLSTDKHTEILTYCLLHCPYIRIIPAVDPPLRRQVDEHVPLCTLKHKGRTKAVVRMSYLRYPVPRVVYLVDNQSGKYICVLIGSHRSVPVRVMVALVDRMIPASACRPHEHNSKIDVDDQCFHSFRWLMCKLCGGNLTAHESKEGTICLFMHSIQDA